MKNKELIICSIIIVLLVAVIIILKIDIKANVDEISYDSYTEKINNKESFMLYIHKTGCPACENFEPSFYQVLNKYDLKAYAVNLSDLTDTEYDEFMAITDIDGTPTVIFYDNGIEKSISDRIVGSIDVDDITEAFKKVNIIK